MQIVSSFFANIIFHRVIVGLALLKQGFSLKFSTFPQVLLLLLNIYLRYLIRMNSKSAHPAAVSKALMFVENWITPEG